MGLPQLQFLYNKSQAVFCSLASLLLFAEWTEHIFLQQADALRSERIDGLLRPDGRLDFTDMRLSQEEHAHTGLADAAAHSQRKIAVEQVALERELARSGQPLSKLRRERLGVDADAHARQLICHVEQRIIHDDIAVEAPVVIVRGASVVDVAGAELAADLHDKHCALCRGQFRSRAAWGSDRDTYPRAPAW